MMWGRLERAIPLLFVQASLIAFIISFPLPDTELAAGADTDLQADPATLAKFNPDLVAGGNLVSTAPATQPLDAGVRLRFSPIALDGGSELTMISPADYRTVASALSETVTSAHSFFSSALGDIPPFKSSIRIMDEETFFRTTGAPPWTNAIYLRGQIIIPVPAGKEIDLDNLKRSVRHEYTHAIVNVLSKGRAPGWLDEGIAQWIEGSENPALRPSLLKFLKNNRPIPFDLLQGGFTRLDTSLVPAAYAQSYLASQALIEAVGFIPIAHYLTELRKGADSPEAFLASFGVRQSEFEYKFRANLIAWSHAHNEPNEHPHPSSQE